MAGQKQRNYYNLRPLAIVELRTEQGGDEIEAVCRIIHKMNNAEGT